MDRFVSIAIWRAIKWCFWLYLSTLLNYPVCSFILWSGSSFTFACKCSFVYGEEFGCGDISITEQLSSPGLYKQQTNTDGISIKVHRRIRLCVLLKAVRPRKSTHFVLLYCRLCAAISLMTNELPMWLFGNGLARETLSMSIWLICITHTHQNHMWSIYGPLHVSTFSTRQLSIYSIV